LFDVNYVPKQMTPDQLRQGIYWLTENLYNADCIARRQKPFFENLWRRQHANGSPA